MQLNDSKLECSKKLKGYRIIAQYNNLGFPSILNQGLCEEEKTPLITEHPEMLREKRPLDGQLSESGGKALAKICRRTV